MKFTIQFHTPFRVATGLAQPGVDAAVDEADPVPSSSLKGVMRAAARDVGIRREVIEATFGTARRPSPWAWSSVELSTDRAVRPRARVRIEADTGTAAGGALMYGSEMWCTSGSFTVDPLQRLDETGRSEQQAALYLAARAVRSFGADRNRGLGWVTIDCDGPRPSEERLAALVDEVGER